MITESSRDCCNKFKSKTMGFGLNKIGTLVLVTLFCFLPSVMPNKDNAFEMKIPASEPLTLLWGIADTTAYVGKLFTYTLPSDAFQGNIVHYDIIEVGKDTLPSWLTFNPLKTELKGIPGPEDLKKGQIYLEVKVTGDDNSHVEDVFAIEILDNTNGPVGSVPTTGENAPKVIRCKRDEPQTIVTVVVDADLGHISPDEKINLLDNMASHLNLAKEMLKLMPVGNKPMFDSSALVVGPGNVKVPKTMGGLVSWIVGCGQVDNGHMSTLQQMESAAANGDMTAAVGHDIVGWHVTNTRFQVKPRRRRQVTPTPSLMPPIPTTVQVSSASVSITPTKTIEVKPTAMPETSTQPSATSTSTFIQPSETSKTTSSSSEATEILPTKTYTTTSSETTTSMITPSTTSTTTTSTVETEPPTTKPSTRPTTPTTTTERKTKKPTTESPCPLGGVRKPPVVNKRMPDQKLTAGSIIRMKIPKDTFTDCYDDSTNELDLKITFSNDEKLPDGFWLQLNNRISRPDILIMNPLNADAGSYTFKLTASNFYEKTTSHNFVVVVEGQEMMTSPPNHELSMTIDTDYKKFMKSLDNRIELSNKVSRIFGDKNSNSLAVTRLEKGSVVYAWTNNSMASNDCPTDDLNALFDKMFNKDGTLTESALDSLQPYKINAAAAEPLGACTNNPDFPKRMMGVKITTTPKPTEKSTEKKTTSTEEVTMKYTEKPKPKSTDIPSTEKTTAAVAAAGAGSGGSDIWITTVVPAIVVVIVLIIALIIACCLYRKRRKGKMKLEEKNRFANSKGVPVIFADEYDEKPNDSTHPLILQDEKPPMPPPEYQRASSETSGNSNSTQPIEDKDIEEIEMEDTSERAPLYSPPPPVTASNNSKPPHVQSSRGPPPYVPP